MDDKFINQLFTLIGACLAATAEGAVVPSSGCRHAIKAQVNDRQTVCLLCRTIIEEHTSFGICVTSTAEEML